MHEYMCSRYVHMHRIDDRITPGSSACISQVSHTCRFNGCTNTMYIVLQPEIELYLCMCL